MTACARRLRGIDDEEAFEASSILLRACMATIRRRSRGASSSASPARSLTGVLVLVEKDLRGDDATILVRCRLWYDLPGC